MGNNLIKKYLNPISTEITDYYDLDEFKIIFKNEIHKHEYSKLSRFTRLYDYLETFLLSNTNETFLLYSSNISTHFYDKIFIKIYFLQRINNKIRYASLHINDVFNNDINYYEHVIKLFAEKFNYLNIQIDNIGYTCFIETNFSVETINFCKKNNISTITIN